MIGAFKVIFQNFSAKMSKNEVQCGRSKMLFFGAVGFLVVEWCAVPNDKWKHGLEERSPWLIELLY